MPSRRELGLVVRESGTASTVALVPVTTVCVIISSSSIRWKTVTLPWCKRSPLHCGQHRLIAPWRFSPRSTAVVSIRSLLDRMVYLRDSRFDHGIDQLLQSQPSYCCRLHPILGRCPYKTTVGHTRAPTSNVFNIHLSANNFFEVSI